MSNQSRIENSLRNISTSFLGYFLTTALAYVTRIVLLRYLSIEYLGVNGLFSNLLSMLSLAEMGIGTAIGFALYKPLADNDEEKVASLMHFYKQAYRVIGLAVCAVGLLMMPFLNVIIQETPSIPENIYVLYLIFLFDTVISYFFSYRGTLLVAAQKNYVTSLIGYIVSLAQHILQILILVIWKSFIPYLLVKTVGVVINNLWVAYTAGKNFPCIYNKNPPALDKQEKKTFFINVKALTVNKICTLLVNNTDNIVITYLGGLVTTGLASNYVLLSNTLSSLVTQVFTSMTASIGNLNAGSDEDRKYEFFHTLSLASFCIYSWAAIGMACVSEELVRLCFGERYILVHSIPIILGVNLFISGVNNCVYTYKGTMGLYRYGQYLLLFTAAINLVLDFVLGRIWGLFGIYVATAVARMLTNTWFEPWVVYKHGFRQNVWKYYGRYGQYWVAFSISLGLSFLACRACNFGALGNLLAKVLICSTVPNIVSWLFFHRTREFCYMKELIRKVLVRLLSVFKIRKK